MQGMLARRSAQTGPKRRHPRYPVRAPALVEVSEPGRRRRLVKASLSDVSRAGLGLRAPLTRGGVAPGTRLVVRFWIGGRAFAVPAELVWFRPSNGENATLGVRLTLKGARPEARRAFRQWTREVERSRPAPGALPAREQLECRLAALTDSLDELIRRVADSDRLDQDALTEVDRAAERLQNAITALTLRTPRRRRLKASR